MNPVSNTYILPFIIEKTWECIISELSQDLTAISLSWRKYSSMRILAQVWFDYSESVFQDEFVEVVFCVSTDSVLLR